MMNKLLKKSMPLFMMGLLSSNVSAEILDTGLTLSGGVVNWDDESSDIYGDMRDNNPYIELSGYIVSDKGLVVASMNIENLDKGDVGNSTFYTFGEYTLGVENLYLYGQLYNVSESSKLVDHSDTVAIIGLSWHQYFQHGAHIQFAAGPAWGKTYTVIGGTAVNDLYGYKGAYAAFMLEVPFSISENDFSIRWFSEYTAVDDADNELFGDASLNWHVNEQLSLTTGYRYIHDNMGVQGSSSAIRLGVNYSF